MPLAKILACVLGAIDPTGSFLAALHSGAAAFLAQAPAPGGGTTTPAGPGFQMYVFWAYGLACVLLCLFTLVTFWQARLLSLRLRDLEERFERAHPEA